MISVFVKVQNNVRKGEKLVRSIFLHFLQCSQPFPKRQILDSSKVKEFADNNSKFDENGGKFSKSVAKHCGKRRNCSLQAISPFPTVFSKDLYLQTRKNQGLFGKGLNTFSIRVTINRDGMLKGCGDAYLIWSSTNLSELKRELNIIQFTIFIKT